MGPDGIYVAVLRGHGGDRAADDSSVALHSFSSKARGVSADLHHSLPAGRDRAGRPSICLPNN